MRNPFKTKRYEYWTEIIRPQDYGLSKLEPPFADKRWRLIRLGQGQDWQRVSEPHDYHSRMSQQGAWLVAVWEREL